MNLEPLLKAIELKKHFSAGGKFSHTHTVRAIDGVSFSLYPGETLGLVGESGSGKSTLGRALLRLIEPTAGKIIYKGQDILALGTTEMNSLRREMQLIFQDPFSALNPRKKIGRLLAEPFEIHNIGSRREHKERVEELLTQVGLRIEHAERYPHEFSGGQLQRVGIARAIALHPPLIVADEPVSSLDVSIQAQVLNLLGELQSSMGTAYLFISHDMAVVEHFCDRVAVLYLGKIVELANREELYAHPRHPYTEALLDAVLSVEARKKKSMVIEGEIPSAANPPQGCAFHTRCPIKEKQCEKLSPPLKEVAPGHYSACFLR